MQQQQHLMQMQPMMAAYYPNNVTTDHIQQYLDENKSLILKIVESQNSGKQSECAENQARLQRNLMYLAAIADSQPQPTMHSQLGQYGQSSSMIQSNPHHSYLQAAQQQQMTNQSLMAARSSMMYSQQHQQQYAAMQSHLSIGGPHIQPASLAGGSGGGDYPDLSRITGGGGGSKQDMEGGEGNN